MSETGDRLRRLFDEIAPPIDLGGVVASHEPVAGLRRNWLVAVAATGVVLLVGVAGWLLVRRGDEPPVVTAPPVVTSTTEKSTTTTTTETSTTTTTTETSTTTTLAARGLDALAAFHAGPVPAPATCPPGSTPNVAGDPAAPRPWVSEYGLGLAAFDRQSGLLVLRGSSWTWVFDPCQNRWEERVAAGPSLGDRASESMAYDEDDDLVVAFDGAAVWTYDTEADTWSRLPASLPSAEGQGRYHPPSGLIVLFEEPWEGVESAWAYDIDAAVRLDLGAGQGERGLVAYDRSGDRWYLYQVAPSGGGNRTWRSMPGGEWVPLTAATPSAEFPWGDLYSGEEIAFDEGSGRIALLSNGQLAAFDPTGPAWEVLYSVSGEAAPTDGPAFRPGAQLVYDSANGRLIVLGGWYGVLGEEGVPAGDVWAYDGRTGEWIELLAAAE